MTTQNTTTTDKAAEVPSWSDAIGKPSYESIADMVAALDCDYDKLAELREDQADWEPDDDAENPPTWESENPDEAEELADLEDEAGDCEDQDEAQQRIDEDPLSVEVRSGWHCPGGEMEAAEYQILLTTGGPAVRIIGGIGLHGEPSSAWLEVQDWGKLWTQYFSADQDTLLRYVSCFYFGE
jgi:hypothetical protein